ncbi:MAG TPA: TPM domain-containing protein, partial [Candidatus Angelobacter sp.]|nr:TPM domain-containing protein [Candidatus Angelobacter sp.]
KVGKAGRNNGIVLLWGPNARAYSLRIADGLSADISDADARQITEQNLLPNFKRGEYYAGLKQTILATMEHLGDNPWDERILARTRAAEQRQRELVQPAEDDEKEQKTNTIIGAGVIGVMVISVLGWIIISSRRERSGKLAELAQASAAIADNLRIAEENAPRIQQLLSDFSRDMPEQDTSSLYRDLAGQPERILVIKADAQRLDCTNLNSYKEMASIRTGSKAEADLLENMRQRISKIKQAREQSRILLEQLSGQNFQISELRDRSRANEINNLLSMSRQDYELARHDSSLSMVDWLMIHELLNSSNSRAQQAIQYSKAEPCYASSTAFSDSSSNSDSFGGGGGFSSGSGSDGSY